jgi:iron complex outermembrane receptor protein
MRFCLLFILTLGVAIPKLKSQDNCAQTCTCSIQGRVYDAETKKPLPYATIRVTGTEKGVVSDTEGYFSMTNICQQEFDIAVSFTGYKTVAHHHDLQHPNPSIYLSPEEQHLESVVVEGRLQQSEQLSTTESRLDAQTLERKQGSSLGELLTELPGVAMLNTGQNINKPMVHGLYGSRLAMYIDGVRHESQSWGQEHAPEIDPSQLSSISVVKGASAIQYGPGALGGAVVMKTTSPTLHEDFSGETGFKVQDNGWAVNNRTQLRQGYDRWAWVATVAANRQGDLRAPDYQLTNTGAVEYSAGLKTLWHPTNQLNIWLQYNYVNQELGILRGSVVGSLRDLANALKRDVPLGTAPFSYQINNPRQKVDHHIASLKGEYTIGKSRFKFQYGFQRNHRQEYDLRRGRLNSSPIIDLVLKAHQTELVWQMPEAGRRTGSVGLQTFYQRTANQPGTQSLFFIPNFRTTTLGLYTQQLWQFDSYSLDAGLRLDYLDAFTIGYDNANKQYRDAFNYTSYSGSVGYSRNIGKNFRLQSQIATAWRPPNVAELYSFGKHGVTLEYGIRRRSSGPTSVIDSDERPAPPEISIGWTNTLLREGSHQSLELTAYINYIDNYIFAQPGGVQETASGIYPFYEYKQANAAFTGLDASYVIKHSNLWRSQVKASYLYAQNLKNQSAFVGLPPANIGYTLHFSQAANRNPHLDAELELQYNFKPFQPVRVIAAEEFGAFDEDGRFIAIRPEEVKDSEPFDFAGQPGGFFLVNPSLVLETKNFTYRLGATNLLNARYRSYTNRLRYFADEAGRTIFFSIKYSW